MKDVNVLVMPSTYVSVTDQEMEYVDGEFWWLIPAVFGAISGFIGSLAGENGGAIVGGIAGAVLGFIAGGVIGGGPGAILGGLVYGSIGAGIGALIDYFKTW